MRARLTPTCALLAGAVFACGDTARDVPSARASAAPAPEASIESSSSARPASPRERWDPPAVPRPGSFLGDSTEDFVGAFRLDGDRVELFAVDGATLKVVWRVPIPKAKDMEHQLRFSVVHSFVAWTVRDHTIHVLDAATGSELRVIELSADTVIDRLCPAQTNNARMLAPTTSGYDAIVYLDSGREANNSGLYPRPACPLVPVVRKPPDATLRGLRKGLAPVSAPELVYQPGFLVARPDGAENERVLVGLDELGKPIGERPLPGLVTVRSVDRWDDGFFVFGNTSSPPRSAVLAVPLGSDAPGWSTTLPCPASRFVTTSSRIYALSDTLQLHVLDRETGKLLATFGDPDPHCP